MQFVTVTERNIADAGRIHSESWRESHQSFCSVEFIEKHTPAAQADFLRREMTAGKQIYMLIQERPVGIVSVHGSLIENLYVLPGEQRKGYGTQLLTFAIQHCVGNPSLWILSNNADAYRLYARNGFRKTGEKKRLTDRLHEIELAWCGEGQQRIAAKDEYGETKNADKANCQ